MKKYKGIIFDLDGTLLNTIEDLGDSMNKVLEEFKLPNFTYDEYKLKVGGGFKGLVVNSFPEDANEEMINKGIKLFSDFYDQSYLNKTKPYKGIVDLLNIFKKSGIKLGVNSNKRNDYTNNLVQKHFKDIPFLGVYGERKGILIKPDPTSALEIAKNMNLKVEEVLYIGDSKPDILTAKNAGMDSVGVLWGFRDRQELEKYGASFIVESPKEILYIL